MEAVAKAKGVRSSARKIRLVADQIRNKPVVKALHILENSPRKGAHILRKLVSSALANATYLHNVHPESLRIKEVFVNEGQTMKRFMPRAHGRATIIRKRTAHVHVRLTDE